MPFSPEKEAEILADLRSPYDQARRERALGRLHDLFYNRVWLFTQSIVKDREDAQDIVCESFIKVWECRLEFNSSAQIKQFLYTTAKNASLDLLRKQKVRTKVHEQLLYFAQNETFIEIRMIDAELAAALMQQISELPDRAREICELTIFENLKTSQIAERLGISIQNVSTQKAIAVKYIRSGLLRKMLLPLLLALVPIIRAAIRQLSVFC